MSHSDSDIEMSDNEVDILTDDEATGDNASDAPVGPRARSLFDIDPKKFYKPIYKYWGEGPTPERPRCLSCGEAHFKGTGGTTNLRRHTGRKHPKILKEVDKETEGATKKPTNRNITDYATSSSSNGDSAKTPKQSRSSLAVPKGVFGSQLYYKANDPRQEQLRRGLATMVGMDLQPVSIVDDPGFLVYSNLLDPRFVVPCRETVMRDCKMLYDVTKQQLRNDLDKSCNKFCFTTDHWTSRVGDAYGSLTIHYIDAEWNLVSSRFGPKHFPGDHDNDAIGVWLHDSFEAWGLERKNVVAATTDNGTNIVKALSEPEVFRVDRLPCFGHVLNLSVQKLFTVKSVVDVVNKCRTLVNKFRRRRKAREALLAAQAKAMKFPYRVIHDCVTRWNSTFFMIARVVYLMDYIVQVSLKHPEIKRLLPSGSEWKLLQNIMLLLQPIADVTNYFSASSYITSSAMSPVLAQLNKHLSTSEDPTVTDHTAIRVGKVLMLDVLKRYYEAPEHQQLLNTICFLDPRFKSFAHAPSQKQCIEQSIQKKLTDEIQKARDKSRAIVSPSASQSATTSKKTGLSSLLGSVYSEKPAAENVQVSSEEQALRELQRYLALPDANIDHCPLKWWKFHSVEFPNLAGLSRNYLCVVATSVPSECLFSVAGNIVSESRNRLMPENVEMFGFLQDNLPKPHLPQYQRMWSLCSCSACRKLMQEKGMISDDSDDNGNDDDDNNNITG